MRPETSKEEFFKKNTASTESDPAMDKWIEEMAECAKQTYYEPGFLDWPNPCVMYDGSTIREGGIVLDGVFTIQQLTALITHMKKYTKEEE